MPRESGLPVNIGHGSTVSRGAASLALLEGTWAVVGSAVVGCVAVDAHHAGTDERAGTIA